MYDFHKRRRSADEIIFYHDFFVRDREDLLCQIKRKTNSAYAQSKIDQALQIANTSSEENRSKLARRKAPTNIDGKKKKPNLGAISRTTKFKTSGIQAPNE